MTINRNRRKYAVGIFTNHLEVQQAIQALEKANFPVQRVSIIAREFKNTNNSQEQIKSGNYAGRGAKKGARIGVLLGGITGVLVGTGAVAIPLVGPIMLAEAMTTAFVTTLAGSGMGVLTGGILGSAIGLVIPKHTDSSDDRQWQYGDCLVGIEGTEEELRQINYILGKQGIEPWKTYHSLADSDFSAIVTQTSQPQTV